MEGLGFCPKCYFQEEGHEAHPATCSEAVVCSIECGHEAGKRYQNLDLHDETKFWRKHQRESKTEHVKQDRGKKGGCIKSCT